MRFNCPPDICNASDCFPAPILHWLELHPIALIGLFLMMFILAAIIFYFLVINNNWMSNKTDGIK